MNWINANELLPEVIDKKTMPVLAVTKKGKRIICYYFPDRFKTVEWEDWDDYSEEDFPYTESDEEHGCVWLRAGWYDSVDCEKCEGYWNSPHDITYWQPLPELPKLQP